MQTHTLAVHLADARNLKPCQAYAQVKLGNTERKSPISPKGTENPYWCEDFSFDVDDIGAELSISIWSQDRLADRLSPVFHGQLRLPVAVILYAERQAIPSSWYPLRSKSGTPMPGEIRVGFSLSRPQSHEDEGSALLSFFKDEGISVPSSQGDMPAPLGGGVLLSHTYHVRVRALNRIIFGPESLFLKDVNELQKTTNLVETPWRQGEDNLPKRVITYNKAVTKFMRSKASEEQKYSRADEKGFVVDVSVNTPDVPNGNTFKVNLQYCMFAGPNTSRGEETALLRVSWDVQFLSSTRMKGMIEKGVRQGLQESFKQYAQVLKKSLMAGGEIQNEEPVQQHSSDDVDLKSDWQLAGKHFCNIRVCITLLSIFLVLALIYSRSLSKSGLEVWKLDLPHTLLSVLLGAQIHLVIGMARKFLGARRHPDQ